MADERKMIDVMADMAISACQVDKMSSSFVELISSEMDRFKSLLEEYKIDDANAERAELDRVFTEQLREDIAMLGRASAMIGDVPVGRALLDLRDRLAEELD